MLAVGSTLYTAQEDKLYAVTTAGVVTPITSPLSGSLPVMMARNNRIPTPDIAIVTENGAFTVTGGGAIAAYPDADVNFPNSVCFLDGYFVFTYGDGTVVASDLNVEDVNSLSNAKAEAKPDGLLRGTSFGSQLFLWGPGSVEVWYDAGGDPFPFARQTVIPGGVGLLGPWAIAGFEDGWGSGQIFVASDRTVRLLDGYTPKRISGRDQERDIQAVTDTTLLRACVYTIGGNDFWVLSSPDWTWEYNTTTDAWNERRSYGLTRWRGETSALFNGSWIIGDTQSAKLHIVEEATSTEDGSALIARLESGPGLKQFPLKARIPSLFCDFTTGQGLAAGQDPIETDPQVKVSWSKTGGSTWSNPVLRSLGQQGEFNRQVRVNNLGQSSHHGLRVALEWSDPPYASFRGATVPSPGARRP